MLTAVISVIGFYCFTIFVQRRLADTYDCNPGEFLHGSKAFRRLDSTGLMFSISADIIDQFEKWNFH